MIKKFDRMAKVTATPTTKNKLFIKAKVDGHEMFLPHGSVVIERWHDGVEHKKATKLWATPKANANNLWEVMDKIPEDMRLVTGNGSFDHFLEFRNTETGEIQYGGTTVGCPLYIYYVVSKKRAMLIAD